MRRLIYILLMLATCFVAEAAAPKWEEVNNPPVEIQVDTTDGEIQSHTTVKDGYVYIVTSEPVTVKVFTILGQMISSEKVAPGTHRLKINARGIYILKIGGTTRRITI